MTMPKLTRSLSRPFVDIRNFVRPHLHSERGITSEQAHALANERRNSGGISPLDFAEQESEQDSSPSPTPSPSASPVASTSAATSYFTEVLSSVPPGMAAASRQWKECTPVLEDLEGEDAAERGFSQLPCRIEEGDEEEEGEEELEEMDDSFATAAGDYSFESDVFASMDPCRQRSHTWHALDLASSSTFSLGLPSPSHSPPASPQLVTQHLDDDDLDADDTGSCSGTPSLLEDRSAFDAASPRDSEDSYGGPTTPNSSFPLSTPGHISTWSPPSSPANVKGQEVEQQSYPFPTSTPPRPLAGFIEVVEIAPTPEKESANEAERSRRKSLMLTSGLGIAFDEEARSDAAGLEEEEAEDEHETESCDPSFRSASVLSQFDAVGFVRADDRQSRAEPSAESYASYRTAIFPDAAHFDTFTRRPREPRPSVYLDAEDDLPFPSISPSELVSSLLAYPNASGPTSHLPEAPPPAVSLPSAPRHIRPIHSPSVSPLPPSTSYFPSHTHSHAPLPRSVSTPSPHPFSRLVPLSQQPTSLHPILRAQASSSTLLSYDMAHLPAPRTPRERPYQVSMARLLLPTAFLGGGKGSGRYGDLGGAIERKKEVCGRPETVGEKRRSLSGMSLSGLAVGRSGGSRSERRKSWFGTLGALPSHPSAILEQPALEEDLPLRHSSTERPSSFLSFFAPPHLHPHSSLSANDPTSQIDEFAVFAPSPSPSASGASTVRPHPRTRQQRPHTAPVGGGGRAPFPSSSYSSSPSGPASSASPLFGAFSPPKTTTTTTDAADGGKLTRSTSLRQSLSLSRWTTRRRSLVATPTLTTSSPLPPPVHVTEPTEDEDEVEVVASKLRKERRRSGLGGGLFGGGVGRSEREREGEELSEWVAVNVK